MRRKYAFESEGVSDAVQTQLEAVEDAVDEKCTTPEECDKVIDKIDAQTDKFNDALAAAKDKAQDCKDGKCDKAEMAQVIDAKMCCLKDMAKTIGVASEGDVPTEEDIKNVKDYLEGAKEIVETKKDELNGESDKGSESDDDDDDDSDDESDDDDDDITPDGENAEEEYTDLDDRYLDACEAFLVGSIPDLKASGYYDQMKTIRKNFNEAKKLANTNPKAAVPKLVEVKKSLLVLRKVVSELPDDSTGMKILNFIVRDILGSVVGYLLLSAAAPVIGGNIMAAKNAALAINVGSNVGVAMETPKQAVKQIDRMINRVNNMILIAKRGEDFMDDASESFMGLDMASEAFGSAKLTSNMSDMDVITSYVKSMGDSIIATPETSAKMREAVKAYNSQYADKTAMTLAVKTVAGKPIIISKQGSNIIDIQFDVGKAKFKAVPVARMRNRVGKSLKKADKAAKKDAKPASESDLFDAFTDRCLNLMTPAAESVDSTDSSSWDNIFVD